jgi:predicted amidohydrolase YtcJ
MAIDLLLFNGQWFSPEIGSPRPGGVAISGERIAARGEDRDLLPLRGPRTRVVDLRGRLVTPGFNDAHIHFSEGGLSLREVDCRGARSSEELALRAAARARELGPGAWVTGRGWDHHDFPGARFPDRAALDRACPENPVFLRRVCGHAAVTNGLALAIAGLESRAREGILYESDLDLVRAKIPEATFAERLAALRVALERARTVGLTSVQDEKGWLDVYEALAASGELTVRATVWSRLLSPLEELSAWRASFARFDRPGAVPLVRPGLLKGYLDGSLGARTALFFEPYADAPAVRGMAVLDAALARERTVAADRAGFQVGLHAIGDRAVATALDCFEAARAANGPRGLRHRVEHAQNVRREDLPRFPALGAIASMQPSHCSGDMGFVRERLGEARLYEAYPWRSLLRAGAAIAFGSDFPIESMDPRAGLYSAVTRLGWDGAGAPLVPEERLPLGVAIDLFTRGAAFAEHAEHEKGTLEPGKLADLVVFGVDLFALPPRELLTAPVDATIMGGRIVHERDL